MVALEKATRAEAQEISREMAARRVAARVQQQVRMVPAALPNREAPSQPNRPVIMKSANSVNR